MRFPKSSTVLLLVALLFALPTSAQKVQPPATKKIDHVDDYHGTKVADPYRWLEDDNAADTKEWVEAENKVTFSYLDSIAERKWIKERLTTLWNYERYGLPNKEGKYYQDVKYVRTACGTAYSGVLIAVEAWLKIKLGNKFKRPRSIEAYRESVAKQDKKLLNILNSAYESLHLVGYYDGSNNANLIKEGFDEAYNIIEYIKPQMLN